MITLAPRRTRRLIRGLRGMSGLGFTMWDLLDASGREDCDPKDVPCVMRNQERSSAVQDLWYSTYQKDPNTANLATPSISLNLDSSQSEVNRFLNNQPLTDETISVGTGPSRSVNQLEQSPFYFQTNDPVPTPPAPKPPILTPSKPVAFLPSPATNPQGLTIINSSGAPGTTGSTLALPTVGGFDLSAIPWWGWLGAVGLGYFALKGAR